MKDCFKSILAFFLALFMAADPAATAVAGLNAQVNNLPRQPVSIFTAQALATAMTMADQSVEIHPVPAIEVREGAKARIQLEILSLPDADLRVEEGRIGGALGHQGRSLIGELPQHIRMEIKPEPGEFKIVAHAGDLVTLRLETNITGLSWEPRLELWSNRSGRWPDANAGESGERVRATATPGVFEIQVPADRDFDYTFRIWNPRTQSWQFVPLPHDEQGRPVNGKVFVAGTRHSRSPAQLAALYKGMHPPEQTVPASASRPLPHRAAPASTRVHPLYAQRPLVPGKLSIVFGAMENRYNRAGGEGDYIADVPGHLAEEGNHVYVVTPHYGSTPVDGDLVAILSIPIGNGFIRLHVKHHQVAPNLSYLFIEDPEHVLFANKPYEDADGLRGLVESIVLSRAITLAPQVLGLPVDAFHYNDWQAALGPVYQRLSPQPDYAEASSIFITHNIAYKGIFERDVKVSIHDRVLGRLVREGALQVSEMDHRTGETHVNLQNLAQLPGSVIYQTEGGLEWFGKVALVKGLTWADQLVAVSEGSKEDMQLTEEEGGFAFGAEGIIHLMALQGRLTAIHNGTDFTPATDPNLATDGFTQFFEADPDVPARKRQNRRAMVSWLKRAVAGFEILGKKAEDVKIYGDLGDVSDDDFILGSLGRLTEQKGVDVMEASLERLFSLRGPKGEKVRLVLGASSEKDDADGMAMEARLKQLATGKFRGQLLFLNGRVDKASRIYAGVDNFLMPSLFEPGGISNLIANRMGTPVTASLTGGLIDFFHIWGGVGFPFPKFTRKTKALAADHLVEKVEEASKIFWNHPGEWDKLVARAAKVDVSWTSRIHQYLRDVYIAPLRRLRGEEWWRNFSAHLPSPEPQAAPGASRAVGWLFNTNNPVKIGKIEGFWQSMAGLWALQRAYLQGVSNVSDLLQAALPVFLGVVLVLLVAHYVTGVVVSEHEQAKRWNPMLSLTATGTAMAGFLGWPLMALGLVVGGPVGLIMILAGFAAGPLLHGWANARVGEVQLAVTPEGVTLPIGALAGTDGVAAPIYMERDQQNLSGEKSRTPLDEISVHLERIPLGAAKSFLRAGQSLPGQYLIRVNGEPRYVQNNLWEIVSFETGKEINYAEDHAKLHIAGLSGLLDQLMQDFPNEDVINGIARDPSAPVSPQLDVRVEYYEGYVLVYMNGHRAFQIDRSDSSKSIYLGKKGQYSAGDLFAEIPLYFDRELAPLVKNMPDHDVLRFSPRELRAKAARMAVLDAFQLSGVEVGLHTVTAGVAYAELKNEPEELAALAEEAIHQGLTPGLDQVEAVKIVRRSRANDKNPIIFLLDNKLDLAGKAAEAGANILDGIGWTPEQVRAIREKYPHIVIISEIAHDSPTVEADFEAAIACGVDGVLLKKYSAWTAKYPEGHPLSIASIRQRHPGMAIVVAGGIFDGKAVTSIRSRLENVLAAVGTNKPQLSEFKAQIQTYSEAAARFRGTNLSAPQLLVPVYADFSDTFVQPAAPKDVFGPEDAHEVIIRSIVAEDIPAGPEREAWLVRAQEAYERFMAVRSQKKGITTADDYKIWLEPFIGRLRREHFDRMVEDWRTREDFFRTAQMVRREFGLQDSVKLPVTFVSGALYQVIDAFRRRSMVAERLDRENIALSIDAHRLEFGENGTYNGEIVSASELLTKGAAAYPENCLVFGDDGMQRLQENFGFWKNTLMNVQSYNDEKITSTVRAQIAGGSRRHPGASRAVGWLFGTNNPVKIGKIEGFWQSFAGLWALQRAYLQGVTNVSDLLHAALPVFLGVVLALFLAHYISGVVVSEHEQARRWNPMLSLKATGTAMIGFLGWPLMALGLAVGGPVGLIMILAGFSAGPILHGIANQQPVEIASAITPEGMTAPFQMEDAPGPTASGAPSRDLKKQAEPLPANELDVAAESMRQQLLARAPGVVTEFLTRTKPPRDISMEGLSAFRQSPPAGFDLSKAGDDQRQTALIRELIGIMQMPGSASVKYKPIDNVLQRYPGVSRPGKGESVHNALKRVLSSIALADAFPADVIAIFDEHTGAGRGESLHALVESIVTLGEQLGRPVVLHMDYAETGEVFLSNLNASPELQEVMAKKRYGTIKHNFDEMRERVARLRRERSSSDSPSDRKGQSFGGWEFDVLERHPQVIYFPEMQTYTSWLMTLNSRYLEWKAMKSMDIDDESSLTRQSWTLALDSARDRDDKILKEDLPGIARDKEHPNPIVILIRGSGHDAMFNPDPAAPGIRWLALNFRAEDMLLSDPWNYFMFHTLPDPAGWSLMSELEISYRRESKFIPVESGQSYGARCAAVWNRVLQTSLGEKIHKLRRQLPTQWPYWKDSDGKSEEFAPGIDAPGAARAVGWLFNTDNPVKIGKIEGFWQSMAGLWALQYGHVPGAFLGVVLALLLAHYISGVVVSEHEQARRWNPMLSLKATSTAMAGFLGWPLMILGLVLGGPVGLFMILAGSAAGPLLHGWANTQNPSRVAKEVLAAA